MGQLWVVPAMVSPVTLGAVPVKPVWRVRERCWGKCLGLLPLSKSSRPESGRLTVRIRRGCEISILVVWFDTRTGILDEKR